MLPDNKEYYYTEENTFCQEYDTIHAFVMADYTIGMHMQEFPEINIVTRGEGKHYIEENCLDVRVGDIFIIPPNVRHGYTGGKGFDVFHVLIHTKFIKKHSSDFHSLESYFDLFEAEPLIRTRSKKPLHLRLSDEEFVKIQPLLSQMKEYGDTHSASDCLARSGLAIAFISMICKAYSEKKTETDNGLRQADENFMKAISTIHEHYSEKLTIDQLAKIARLSRSAFVSKFTELCKLPPSKYIMRRRLEAAEYMLLNTGASIVDIAFETGFYDVSHLNKAFSAYKGLSPAAFRKQRSNASL